MNISQVLFEELFPKYRKTRGVSYAWLYEGLELNLYKFNIIGISIKINLKWEHIIIKVHMTNMHLRKIKELHERLHNPF